MGKAGGILEIGRGRESGVWGKAEWVNASIRSWSCFWNKPRPTTLLTLSCDQPGRTKYG